jgi:soluble P-type ATPase
VTIKLEIPGWREIHVDHLVLDVNGTLTDRGRLLSGVEPRIAKLRSQLRVHLVSADTYGTLDSVAQTLVVTSLKARSGRDKLARLEELGREQCAVIGNGANDELVLEAAALGIAVIGPEGASSAAVRAADVVCVSVLNALDLLLDPMALSATLRP